MTWPAGPNGANGSVAGAWAMVTPRTQTAAVTAAARRGARKVMRAIVAPVRLRAGISQAKAIGWRPGARMAAMASQNDEKARTAAALVRTRRSPRIGVAMAISWAGSASVP